MGEHAVISEHALLSPSSAERWMACPPSVAASSGIEEEPASDFAEEGTYMHELAALRIKHYIGEVENGKFNELSEKMKLNRFYNSEIEAAVNVYVELAVKCITEARAKTKDAVVYVEKRLDLSRWVEDCFGTSDFVIAAEGTVQIIDFKGGKGVAVAAEDNPQLKMYGLGALDLFEDLYGVEIVRMTICQPRMDNITTWVMSAEKLEEWGAEELKPKAELAIAGDGQFTTGAHCRYCRARGVCRERAKEPAETAATFDFRQPALLTDEEVERILPLSAKLAAWASDIYSYALSLAISQGKKWKGYKVAPGRSIRKYKNEEEVVETLDNLGYKDIYKKSLIGVPDMEKLLGKKNFKVILGDLVEKPAGKPTLVPEVDKRETLLIEDSAEADFN